ncbi:MAG: UvrD-helicase domain-containing protein [Planctomycetota bacterium]
MPASHYEPFDLANAPLDEGTVLLEASAGTGKTYTLTGILVRMLLEGVVEHVEEALVVTFTVAAADELKNRLRAALQRAMRVCAGAGDEQDPFFRGLAGHGPKGAQRLRRALDEFDQASVQTIHSFCKRMLDDSAFESDEPFDLDFAVDETPLWHAAAADALRMVRQHDGPALGALLAHERLTPDQLVGLFRSWQRYPDVQLEPAQPQLDVCLANLGAAMSRAAATWDDEQLAHAATLNWYAKKAPGSGEPAAWLQHYGGIAKQQPELALALYEALSPQRLQKTLKKESLKRIDRPFYVACGEVVDELERARDHLRSELLLAMRRRLTRHKEERAVVTFDDLLARAHAAVTDERSQARVLPAVQDRYRIALIDEFQDTDQRQYEILATCFRNRPMFLVGDPKQSIYGFRGADLRTYLAATEDAIERNTLKKNFRSARCLVDAVHDVFHKSSAFVEPGIRMPKVQAAASAKDLLIQGDGSPQAALQFRVFPVEPDSKGVPKMLSPDEGRKRIAADLTAEIARLLADGEHDTAAAQTAAGRTDAIELDGRRVQPGDIAVLTRRNAEAVLVQDSLRQLGIASVIGKAGDVFETEELIEIERLMLAIQRPNDLLRARAAMTTRLWGYDAPSLAALDADSSESETKLENELLRLEQWRQLWIRRGFVVMKEQMLQELGAEARLLQRSDGERRLTNLQQLCEMLHQAEHEHRLSPEGLLHWLRDERSHKDDIDYQRRELRLESDAAAVQILTMHGSKGLQYEIVFCPFLWDGRGAHTENTPIEQPDGGRQADGHKANVGDASDGRASGESRRFAYSVDQDDPGWRLAEKDRLAEDVRLAYVAMTRAKRRCYVHWGAIGWQANGYMRSALAWLLQPQTVDTSKPDWPQTWSKAYRDRSGSLLQDLQVLADASHGAISMALVPERLLPRSDAAPPEPGTPVERQQTLESKPPGPHVPPAYRPRNLPGRAPRVVHSFSSLCADRPTAALRQGGADPSRHGFDEALQRPRGIAAAVGAAATGAGAAPAPGTPTANESLPEAAPEAAAEAAGIFGFARGAEAGQCLHTVLEHVALTAAPSETARTTIARTLRRHGLENPEDHPGEVEPVDVVMQNIRDLALAHVVSPARVPLDDGDSSSDAVPLGDICGGRRVAEWKFTLPTAAPDLIGLARTFAASSCPIAAAYAPRLAMLPQQRFAGYLTGFVDLIAEHEGRYWIVDWKSNHLGNAIADYGSEELLTSMREHDYVLQYHLYTLAWHRHLRARLPDYDYDTHFAGICYAYLRGAAPGATTGMFSARPPRDLVQALDAWASGEVLLPRGHGGGDAVGGKSAAGGDDAPRNESREQAASNNNNNNNYDVGDGSWA